MHIYSPFHLVSVRRVTDLRKVQSSAVGERLGDPITSAHGHSSCQSQTFTGSHSKPGLLPSIIYINNLYRLAVSLLPILW